MLCGRHVQNAVWKEIRIYRTTGPWHRRVSKTERSKFLRGLLTGEGGSAGADVGAGSGGASAEQSRLFLEGPSKSVGHRRPHRNSILFNAVFVVRMRDVHVL